MDYCKGNLVTSNLNLAEEKVSRDRLEKHLEALFEQAETHVGLSEDDSVYDLHYISGKLALLSSHLETLSDIQFSLTKISLEVRRKVGALKSLLTVRERELKGGLEYIETPRDQKSVWLGNQLQELRELFEGWQFTERMVSEIREAVDDRSGILKRLDSDLRLHSKLYEAKVTHGAHSPASLPGGDAKDIDL